MKGVIKKTLKSKKAEGYVDSGVKILIAVVIGALLLGGVYMLFKDTILPTAQSKVESLFDYSQNPEPKITSFKILDTEYQIEEGMTWEEWVNSDYNTGNYNIADNRIRMSTKYVYISYGKKTADYVKPGDVITENYQYNKVIESPIIPR